MSERYFSYDDLAKKFGVGKSWLYAQVKAGRLVPWEGSTYRCTRFTESAVADFEGTRSLRKRSGDSMTLAQVVETTVTGSHKKS